MDIIDPNQPPTGTEMWRRINAMQAAMLDDSLPRTLREAEVRSAYRRGQGFAILGIASLVVMRAKEGMARADARALPLDELRKALPASTSPMVREGVVRLCSIYDKDSDANVEGDELVNTLVAAGEGFDTFIAFCHLANEMASLVVQFDPTLTTKTDLLRREALDFERTLGSS